MSVKILVLLPDILKFWTTEEEERKAEGGGQNKAKNSVRENLIYFGFLRTFRLTFQNKNRKLRLRVYGEGRLGQKKNSRF